MSPNEKKIWNNIKPSHYVKLKMIYIQKVSQKYNRYETICLEKSCISGTGRIKGIGFNFKS